MNIEQPTSNVQHRPSISVLAVITARGGSKGIPGKNMALVGGKPLVVWTVEAALKARHVTRTIISTDDASIAAAAREAGAEVPFMRPPELAADDTPHMDVIEHALRWIEQNQQWRPDYLLLLQPTSPLREARDLDAAIELAERCGADSVIGVCETPAHPHWMMRIDNTGHLSPYLPKGDTVTVRQRLSKIYIVNGAIYLARPELLLTRHTFYSENTYGFIMPRERSIDIDEPFELKLCEMLMREQNHAGL